MALAAACALAACGADPEPDAVFVVAPHAETELGSLIDGGPELVIAGERLNVGLLRRFYARHGFEPVWTTRQAQANSLVGAVLRAGDQGLDPELFHANLLRHAATLAPLDRELLLSDAFLSYADALARGAVPVEHRRDDETLTPGPVDVAGRARRRYRQPRSGGGDRGAGADDADLPGVAPGLADVSLGRPGRRQGHDEPLAHDRGKP